MRLTFILSSLVASMALVSALPAVHKECQGNGCYGHDWKRDDISGQNDENEWKRGQVKPDWSAPGGGAPWKREQKAKAAGFGGGQPYPGY